MCVAVSSEVFFYSNYVLLGVFVNAYILKRCLSSLLFAISSVPPGCQLPTELSCRRTLFTCVQTGLSIFKGTLKGS